MEAIFTSDVPIEGTGCPIRPDDLEEEEEYILAVLPDDRIVGVFGYTRIRVGAPGAGDYANVGDDWACKLIEDGEKGLYDLISSLPLLIKEELERREKIGMRRANFEKYSYQLGAQFLWDRELVPEVLEEGAAEWLKGFQ